MRYLYKPYHSWRHRFRREKIRKWLFRAIWLIALWAAFTAVSGQIHIEVKERLVKEQDASEDVFGIGISPESGEVFWFQKDTKRAE